MDGLMLLGSVPVVMGIWDTAVVDEADGGIYTTNGRAGSAWQSIGLDDAAERVLARVVVVKRQKWALRFFGHGFELRCNERL